MATEPGLLKFINPKLHQNVIDTVFSVKLHKHLDPEFTIKSQQINEIHKVIDGYELAIVDSWKYASDVDDSDQTKEFCKTCAMCFNLLQVLSIPDTPEEKMKHVLKLLTYAYLGEKWDDMKRFILEHDEIFNVYDESEQHWDLRLFSTIYQAILHLTRKNSWSDLREATKYIVKLRDEQKVFEKKFLSSNDQKHLQSSASEIASLYHLAKSVELLGTYMIQGNPSNILESLDYHFEKALSYSRYGRIIELDILLEMLRQTFKKMVTNSIWFTAGGIIPKFDHFIELLTKKPTKPVFELLYPQKTALKKQGLLDPASKNIVVNLPTSSGKTMIAEFRIIQALNQFKESHGKIVYVVPTKALVNQITSRLRKDLGPKPLDIKVEKMSGALNIDSFEKNTLESNTFDILVATPEKLNLIIRNPKNKHFTDKIVLMIIDEAHNISNMSRGLNLEMLIANVQKDCKGANILLMSPFVKNHHEVAKWLDPTNPKSINLDLHWWAPNDRVIGLYYAEGEKRHITTLFKPLITNDISSPDILSPDTDYEIKLGEKLHHKYSISKLKQNKAMTTSLAASHLWRNHNILILAHTIDSAWSIADYIYKLHPNVLIGNPDIDMISRYVSDELGKEFPLVKYLKRGIGVHHSGLPDDIRELMEWLMEKQALKILVATTTIAQGVNFPVNGILVNSYSIPRQQAMTPIDFWNLVGRSGRVDQRSLGLVGIAVDAKDSESAKKAMDYVHQDIEDLTSVLSQLMKNIQNGDTDFLVYTTGPEWSAFLQYISHMYRQSNNLKHFIAEINITLKRTYGYNQMNNDEREILSAAVTKYASSIDSDKNIINMSDVTGFSTHTLNTVIEKINELNIPFVEWNSNKLFSGSSPTLTRLAGIMINDMPEIKKEMLEIGIGKKQFSPNEIGMIISDWVSGKNIVDIASKYFDGDDEKSIRKCVQVIYRKIANSATWGLAALQKIPDKNSLEHMTDKEIENLHNLSAMIYYGVNSDEAILMRSNNVPRSLSLELGRRYKNENKKISDATFNTAMNWIKNLDDAQWDSAIPKNKKLSGVEYKKIWEKLSGIT